MADDIAKKKDKSWLWPKIDDAPSALEAATAGVVGGVIIIAGLLIATALVNFSGSYALFNAEDLQSFFIYQAVQIVLAAFLTWRVYTGKGRFASILLLTWIVVEVAMKLLAGQLNGKRDADPPPAISDLMPAFYAQMWGGGFGFGERRQNGRPIGRLDGRWGFSAGSDRWSEWSEAAH